MPALAVFDTVVLKANRQLVGIVDCTHRENNDSLQDVLIIAHVPVDQHILTEFVTTGIPPKNHVFVRFSDEAQGSSLVHENDVVLLDRSFNLGDMVKKENSHMLGTVTSVHETYVLQPVWVNTFNLLDDVPSAVTIDQIIHEPRHTCSSDCPFGVLPHLEHPWQSCLLHNIPGEELKKAEDVLEADYIVKDDWIGIADELELLVIVLLEDESIVVVHEPDELYIPVEDSGKPLVSLPEFDNLARPDPFVTLQGWSATIPPHDFQCGQLVITNQKNLRLGRWLRGRYDPKIKPQGRILDVRTQSMHVRWLACNAFTPEHPVSVNQPQEYTELYENLGTFPKRSELRSDKSVSIYDPNKFPRSTESRTRWPEGNSLRPPGIHTPTDFRPGDHVKFRDQAGAALKYKGTPCKGNVIHGRFDRIAAAVTFGFDVNELKVICGRQDATVLWQDGTSSVQSSQSLVKFTLFEPELAPADLVVAREGMKQTATVSEVGGPSQAPFEFNEMKFFESHYDLLPKRVGVVQNVNQEERVAQVRWFADADVRLTSYGHEVSGDSRFGRLSEMVEDVSLYEVMTFPALTRRLRDMVIIPPASISSQALALIDARALLPASTNSHGQASLSEIIRFGSFDLLGRLHAIAYSITRGMQSIKVVDHAMYKPHNATDWVGEIIELGRDGIVTVRVNTRAICRDIRLEHDQILCLIDEAAIAGADLLHDQASDNTDMEMSLDGSGGAGTPSTISETVEYEGGERLDNDSGDENWEDEDETNVATDEKTTPVPSTETVTPSVEPVENFEHVRESALTKALKDRTVESSGSTLRPEMVDSLLDLRSKLPSADPPSFSILDTSPSTDQYEDARAEWTPSSTFLKRVVKEHHILASSLPRGEIYVRTYETRLDLIRCLILGPRDTPYEHAPFLIDLQLGKNFPREPPLAHFHSWTSGLGRINPNLYEEGKICLSLLGTWPGKAESEGWSEKATILQLLLSIQGLVLVQHPFYNEAGFENAAEDQRYVLEAQRYNEKAYVMARGFVKHAISAPVPGLEDVLAWLYLGPTGSSGLLHTVISRSCSLMERSETESAADGLMDGRGSTNDQTQVFLRPLSRGAIVMLRRVIRSLEKLLTDRTNAAMSDTTHEVS